MNTPLNPLTKLAQTPREYTLGLLALVLLAANYGLFAPLSKLISSEMLPLQQLALRILLAAMLASIVLGRHLSPSHLRAVPARDWRLIVLRCAVGYIGAGWAYVAALTHTSIANVAFLGSLPFEAVVGLFLLKERVTSQVFLGISLCVIGTWAISSPEWHFAPNLGDFLAGVSAITISIYYVLRRFQSSGVSDLTVTPLILWIGGIMLAVSALAIEGMPSGVSGQTLFLSLILGVLNAANVFLANYGFARVSSAVAGTIIMLESVFAVGFGFLILGEKTELQSGVGGCLILLGAWISQYRGKRS
jgi:drug/metabolite transporter (DMT)-like permease